MYWLLIIVLKYEIRSFLCLFDSEKIRILPNTLRKCSHVDLDHSDKNWEIGSKLPGLPCEMTTVVNVFSGPFGFENPAYA